MEPPFWAPEAIDVSRANSARIYDYHLGGRHNFEVDRKVAEQITRIMPELPVIMRANRAFMRRAVRFLVGAGIRQFLDLGSGIPTVGNVHEIVQAAAPESKVVYIDTDPVAVAHCRALLAGNDNAQGFSADLRDVSEILAMPEVNDLIDFTVPVAILLVAVLHFIPDSDDPAAIVASYRDAVVPGSYMVISHAADSEDGSAPAGADAATAAYSKRVAEATLRTRDQVAALCAGMELLDPGVVYVNQWRPDPQDTEEADPSRRVAQIAAVARKPSLSLEG
ncbi:SAM-dependent methyltransferase [Actinoplanes sp. NPDC051513]|uniref:SAM-dependent methyltransferase n=1 Tax=Actinoplanes sp. NPDC051513 TaxID=3363908 RepID=UPI00379B23AF